MDWAKDACEQVLNALPAEVVQDLMQNPGKTIRVNVSCGVESQRASFTAYGFDSAGMITRSVTVRADENMLILESFPNDTAFAHSHYTCNEPISNDELASMAELIKILDQHTSGDNTTLITAAGAKSFKALAKRYNPELLPAAKVADTLCSSYCYDLEDFRDVLETIEPADEIELNTQSAVIFAAPDRTTVFCAHISERFGWPELERKTDEFFRMDIKKHTGDLRIIGNDWYKDEKSYTEIFSQTPEWSKNNPQLAKDVLRSLRAGKLSTELVSQVKDSLSDTLLTTQKTIEPVASVRENTKKLR